MTTEIRSLGEMFPVEQARCREVLAIYKSLGSVGAFGAAMIEDVLRRADKAAVEQDTVAMVRIYQEMCDVE